MAHLFHAIVWGVILILAIVAVFWNPAHFVTAGIALAFCGLHIYDYIQERKK